jgi:hypothetical protein
MLFLRAKIGILANNGRPWFEHAKFSPNCVYLRYIKGSAYIHDVKKLKNTDSDKSEHTYVID